MKKVFPVLLVLIVSNLYSQDSVKIRQIDTLVFKINASDLPSKNDTLIQDRPDWGLKMTTYLTQIVNGGELIKYVNHVNTTMTANGEVRKMTISNTFYYQANKLIKVEEYLLEDGNRRTADWYYWDDKPLYYTLQSDKAETRANMLLELSKTMQKKAIK